MFNSIGLAPSIIENVDKGLLFFCGAGVALLGLAALEHFGVPINHTAVRVVVWIGGAVAVTTAVLTNPLWAWIL